MSELAKIASYQNLTQYREHHWSGSFSDYLELVRRTPGVTRNAYQRAYDMIMSYGRDEYIDSKKKLVHYPFFDDPDHGGRDAIFGLDIPLMRLVNVFKSAALGYGTERRVILLHGPVGSSKSTIARLLKKGFEAYSRKNEGAVYSFDWQYTEEREGAQQPVFAPCPMNEDPLHLIPLDYRHRALADLGIDPALVHLGRELCPHCRFIFRELLRRYEGNLEKVLGHVRVRRFLLSEKDRVGIGTFQPKDEKNQDSTELTGDINYRKIAEYGSDSDPRAFNF
ncbi:MAG: serine protein kinase, partial [Deltaproteobacteria bacterium]